MEHQDDELPEMSGIELIAAFRGGVPDCCDFCRRPYTDARYPVPEEAGMWACIECWNRWEESDARLTP